MFLRHGIRPWKAENTREPETTNSVSVFPGNNGPRSRATRRNSFRDTLRPNDSSNNKRIFTKINVSFHVFFDPLPSSFSERSISKCSTFLQFRTFQSRDFRTRYSTLVVKVILHGIKRERKERNSRTLSAIMLIGRGKVSVRNRVLFPVENKSQIFPNFRQRDSLGSDGRNGSECSTN